MTPRRSDRVYALLLRAYPPQFRAAYGREMTLLFRDLARDAERDGVGFWWRIVTDVVRSAPALRLEALHARLTATRLGGRMMRAMGLLAMVVGILETANAVTELAAGGIGGRGAVGSLAVLLAVIGGALLVVAGLALRNARTQWARSAAIACLVLFVLARTLSPWMSIASTTVGITLPLVLLVWASRDRGNGLTA